MRKYNMNPNIMPSSIPKSPNFMRTLNILFLK